MNQNLLDAAITKHTYFDKIAIFCFKMLYKEKENVLEQKFK